MEYQVIFIQSVLKDDIPKIKKSGINLEILYRSLKKLERNPYGSSRAKSGDLSNIRGMDWNKGYRVLFIVDDMNKIVKIVSIDCHDEAYKKAKRRKQD